MSLKANTLTVFAAVAPSAAEAAAREPDAVECPERQWVAQRVWQGEAVLPATAALGNGFRERSFVKPELDVPVCARPCIPVRPGDATPARSVSLLLGLRSAVSGPISLHNATPTRCAGGEVEAHGKTDSGRLLSTGKCRDGFAPRDWCAPSG